MSEILPDWPLLTAFLLASVLLAVMPGPAVLYIVSRNEGFLVALLNPKTAGSAFIGVGLFTAAGGKSCLYIRNLNQVELPVLEALIGESVRAMSRQRVDR